MSSAASRALVALALVVALAACKKKSPPPAPGVPGLATCLDALHRAPGLPAHERATAVLRGCPVCGPSFEPLIAAAGGHNDLIAIDGLVAACKPTCGKRALGRWRALMSDAMPGQGLNR